MRILLAFCLMGMLAACATIEANNAPEEVIRAKTYRHAGPPSLTVFTMVNNRTGSGGHTALMINGSQRVLFDPAGSFFHETVPERNDVLFGITPAVEAAYKSAHARSTYHVVTQTVEVTPEQAEIALRLAQQAGPVPSAFCSSATTQLLQQVPGFGDIRQSLFPTNLMDQMEQRPGVVTDRYFENDEGTIVDGVANVQL